MNSLQALFDDLPQIGQLQWIALRPRKKAAMEEVDNVRLCTKLGIIGDRYAGRSGKRHVTLIQAEHLPVIAACLGITQLDPARLRRNLVVSGLNLIALKGKRFCIGDTVLEYTGLCHPCSAMQTEFGPGGYNAVRGHGGINARVVQGGTIRHGDSVHAVAE